MDRKARTFSTLFMVRDVSRRIRGTLELGVVVAIVMAVTVFGVRMGEAYVLRTQFAEGLVMPVPVRADLVTFRAEKGRWPTVPEALANETLGVDEGLGGFVERLELGGEGVISVVFNADTPKERLRGQRLSFRPFRVPGVEGASIAWGCAAHPAPDGMVADGLDETTIDPDDLPAICRRKHP